MPTISLDFLSTECLIAIANALSEEISNPACGYEGKTSHVTSQFNIVCNVIESRGDCELSDYVTHPDLMDLRRD